MERRLTAEILAEMTEDEMMKHLEDALELTNHQEETIAELEMESANLKSDVDTLLELLEEEKRVNSELNKMIQSSDKKNAALEKQNEKLKLKLGRKGDSVVLAELEEQDRLRREVDALTASQAHLIESLDASADELDRVTRENGSLVAAVERLRESCVAYESQVQEHLKVEARLKDFLEEGAQYIDGRISTDGAMDEVAKAKAHVASLEDSVTRWQARCGSLEVQVMALCAELNRLSTCASGMQAFVVGALADLEGRCSNVCVQECANAVMGETAERERGQTV